MWINRTFELLFNSIDSPLRIFPVWLILGARQTGKSSLLQKCALDSPRRYINLDDPALRARANEDPILFAREIEAPCIIDEIQYAPQLLSSVKLIADQQKQPGIFWLTGSQNFEVMSGVRESLAGRVAILNLLGLTDEEKGVAATSPEAYFLQILKTNLPGLQTVVDSRTRDLYLSSYVQTYIERDIRELVGIQKRREFETLLKSASLRTAQLVNFSSIASVTGVSDVTIREWLNLLNDSFLIDLVRPYLSNKSKRLIKNPKLYFQDAGLAAYLSGWKDSEMLRLGNLAGAIFETHVYSNIKAFFAHRAIPAEIYFWRTKDGQEIDFLIETQGKVYPIEVKLGYPSAKELVDLSKIREENWQEGRVLSLAHSGSEAVFCDGWKIASPLDLGFLEGNKPCRIHRNS
jgi:hypothetical protein